MLAATAISPKITHRPRTCAHLPHMRAPTQAATHAPAGRGEAALAVEAIVQHEREWAASGGVLPGARACAAAVLVTRACEAGECRGVRSTAVPFHMWRVAQNMCMAGVRRGSLRSQRVNLFRSLHSQRVNLFPGDGGLQVHTGQSCEPHS